MGLKCLLQNISFLSKRHLWSELAYLKKEAIDNSVENAIYEMPEEARVIRPQIMTIDETISTLAEHRSSIARFGDGELDLVANFRDIVGQTRNERLRERLIEVLCSHEKDMLIAIPRVLYYPKEDLTPAQKTFWRQNGSKLRDICKPYIRSDENYAPTEISLAYIYYPQRDMKNYFDSIRNLWYNREIVVVCGFDIQKNIRYNIFDNASAVEYFIPQDCIANAFEHYEQILNKIKTSYSKDKLFILILGATATVLAYDLHSLGFQAYDLGHIAKSYDHYMSGKKIAESDFFVVDK